MAKMMNEFGFRKSFLFYRVPLGREVVIAAKLIYLGCLNVPSGKSK